jgi:hypothetical protein
MIGHIVPEFHGIARKQGIKQASLYVFAALVEGDIHPNSGLGLAEMNFARTAFGLLSPKQKKLALQEFKQNHGTEAANKLIAALHYRGGGSSFEPNWLHVYTQIFYWVLLFCFFCVYIPTFLYMLNEEFYRNPGLERKFYELYLHHFTPIGYKINKKNYLITCSIITDDFFELNVG